MITPKRYVQVGLGSRSWMYSQAMVETYPESCQLVGLCDLNAGRLHQRIEWARSKDLEIPGYDIADFDRMIAECQPDWVIVTSKDSTHDHYICRAMEPGCD